MQELAVHVFRFFSRLGAFGLLGLGILDSSFLFMPLGNDLLVVAFSARRPHLLWYYALMAAAGSVLGTLVVDLTSRKLGEKGLEGRVSEKRLAGIKKRFENRAALSLIGASLMPPPFPFTVFIITAAALQYSRKRLLTAVAAGRLLRFTILGLLAMVYGRHILRLAELPIVRWFIIVLAVISIIGSAISIYKMFHRKRPAGTSKTLQPA
jgi:membrane protein YqaA with SNARE-associated domain